MLTLLRKLKPARCLRCPPRDESGSVIMAILIIAALSVSVVGVLTSVQGGLKTARIDQDRTSAFQHANGGIDHALYRIDQSAGRIDADFLPSTPLCPVAAGYCVTLDSTGTRVAQFQDEVCYRGTSTVVPCNDLGPIDVRYKIVATADPCRNGITRPTYPADGSAPTATDLAVCTSGVQTNQWNVQSVGTEFVNRQAQRQRKAVATIKANLIFENGFFTDRGFTITGNQTTPLAYDSSTHPVQHTNKNNPYDPAGILPCCPTTIDIGSNGTFSGSGIPQFAPRWHAFNMYGRASQAAADADCTGCTQAGIDALANGTCSSPCAIVNPIKQTLDIHVPQNKARRCFNGGNFAGVVPPGDYSCDVVTMYSMTVGSGGTGVVRIWPRCKLTFAGTNANDAPLINLNQSPLKLQIFFDTPDPTTCASIPNNGTLCDAVVFALLDIPAMTLDCPGAHQAFIYGAIAADIYKGTGNQFQFFWDAATQFDLSDGKFHIDQWRECPVTAHC